MARFGRSFPLSTSTYLRPVASTGGGTEVELSGSAAGVAAVAGTAWVVQPLSAGAATGRAFLGGVLYEANFVELNRVLTDTFTDTDNTLVSSHTPDYGTGNWANEAGSASMRIYHNAAVAGSGLDSAVSRSIPAQVSVERIMRHGALLAGYAGQVDVANAGYTAHYALGAEDVAGTMTGYVIGSGGLASSGTHTLVDGGLVRLRLRVCGDVLQLYHGNTLLEQWLEPSPVTIGLVGVYQEDGQLLSPPIGGAVLDRIDIVQVSRASGQATVSGTMYVVQPFSAAAAGTATVAGTLAIEVVLTGAVTGQAAVAATPLVTVLITADATGTATASGTAYVIQPFGAAGAAGQAAAALNLDTTTLLTVGLYQGAVLIASTQVTPTATLTDTIFTLSAPELASITDWADLRLRFTALGSDAIKVTQAFLTTPAEAPAGDFVELDGDATGVATASATAYVVLESGTATVTGVATASATAYVEVPFTGAATGQASATATPAVVLESSTADADGVAVVAGIAYVILASNTANADGAATAAATMYVVSDLVGALTGAATVSGTLDIVDLNQYARPIADISIGSWTTNTGSTSNLYATLDEAVTNDADFIQSATSPTNDIVRLQLGSIEEPDAGTVSLFIRHRAGT